MVTVDGVEVRSEEVKDLAVKFEDLTEKGQQRVFLQCKEGFVEEAINSNFSSVRELVWQNKQELSSEALNKAIIRTIIKGLSASRVLELLAVPGFELDEGIRAFLSCSKVLTIKKWVAENARTSLELLKTNQLFMTAARDLIQSNACILFDAIVKNPNFKWDEEMEQKIENFSPKGRKIIRERIEKLKN